MDFAWLEKVFETLEYDLYDVSLKKDGLGQRISIEIEKQGFITFDDCQIVSHKVLEALKTLNLPEEPRVEVASAGAERPLKTLKNFKNATGKTVFIKTHEDSFNGTIESVSDHDITITIKKHSITLPLSTIKQAHLTLV